MANLPFAILNQLNPDSGIPSESRSPRSGLSAGGDGRTPKAFAQCGFGTNLRQMQADHRLRVLHECSSRKFRPLMVRYLITAAEEESEPDWSLRPESIGPHAWKPTL